MKLQLLARLMLYLKHCQIKPGIDWLNAKNQFNVLSLVKHTTCQCVINNHLILFVCTTVLPGSDQVATQQSEGFAQCTVGSSGYSAK